MEASVVQEAMNKVMGCADFGGAVAEVDAIERALLPAWRTVPKNVFGRIERRSLRYVVHRFLGREWSVVARGFELLRAGDDLDFGATGILGEGAPAFVSALLESDHAWQKGFDLRDAAIIIAVVQQLIIDSEVSLLEETYHRQQRRLDKRLSRARLEKVVEEYMIRWLFSSKPQAADTLLRDRALLRSVVPQYDSIATFAHGKIRALDYRRQRQPLAAKPGESNPLARDYSFADARRVVTGIALEFASFWESECGLMKEILVGMDSRGTGRVPLSKFYSATLDDGQWRFGEAASYLRELGVIDDSSSWQGEQVIIPNYIQSASNCVVSHAHYMVCCRNDCEAVLADLEAGIGDAEASPADILAVIKDFGTHGALEDDGIPVVQGHLSRQLTQIAVAHGGRVPLHGRLFAQWLHYVFPRECPFPHKTGTVASVSPMHFEGKSAATDEEMLIHVATAEVKARQRVETNSSLGKEELHWMSRWSEDEELVADHMRAPWGAGWSPLMSLAVLLLAAAVGGQSSGVKMLRRSESLLPMSSKKAHYC